MGSMVQVAVGAMIHVPFDQPTIQAGIDASAPGDTVLVSPGTYQENIDFHGKAIVVESEQGPAATVIDGGGMATVVQFASGEAPSSMLSGFTIRNGLSSGFGGGIFIGSSSPSVINNMIVDNIGCDGGGGIAIWFGSPIIRGNVIARNLPVGCNSSGGAGGGGIMVFQPGAAQILYNTVMDNGRTTAGIAGGGILLYSAGFPVVLGNTITGNSCFNMGGGIGALSSGGIIADNLITGNQAVEMGGGLSFGATHLVVVNNTIVGNAAPQGSDVFVEGYDTSTRVVSNIVQAGVGQTALYCSPFYSSGPLDFAFNDVFAPSGTTYSGACADQTGIAGNISADPLFVDPGGNDYHLQRGSPCIDAGTNAEPDLPATDLDDNPRIVDGNGDDVAIVDMGAYEAPALPVVIGQLVGSLTLTIRTPGTDRFAAVGTLTLGAGSDGIDPSTEFVHLTLADADGQFFDQALPAGVFRRVHLGRYRFRMRGGATGVQSFSLREAKVPMAFTLQVRGGRLDLSGSHHPPASMRLRIGNDVAMGAPSLTLR